MRSPDRRTIDTSHPDRHHEDPATMIGPIVAGPRSVMSGVTPGRSSLRRRQQEAQEQEQIAQPISANAAERCPSFVMIGTIPGPSPNRSSARLLGTSSRKYPTKKLPAPEPWIVGQSPPAFFI